MSEERGKYETGVISELRQVIAEVQGHYAIIPDELVRSGEPSAIAVYAALDRIARGDKTQTETAISYLAEYCHQSSRTVQRALNWLETNGFISAQRVGPGRLSNRYFLPFRSARLAKNTNHIGTEIGQNYQQTNSNQEHVLQEIGGDPLEPPLSSEDFADATSSDEQSPTKTEKKTSDVTETMKAIETIRGYVSGNYPAEAKACKWMLRHDYTQTEIVECYQHLKADYFWASKTLTMMTVQTQIGEWKAWVAKGKPEPDLVRRPAPSRNGQPGPGQIPGPGQRGYVRTAQEWTKVTKW